MLFLKQLQQFLGAPKQLVKRDGVYSVQPRAESLERATLRNRIEFRGVTDDDDAGRFFGF